MCGWPPARKSFFDEARVERGHAEPWETVVCGGSWDRLSAVDGTSFKVSMRIQIHLRIVTDDDSVISEDEILHLDKGCDRLEAIGLSLAEAKAVLANTQERLVTAQTVHFLDQCRYCELCGCQLRSKGRCRIRFHTAYGTIPLVSPRFHRYGCQLAAAKSFSPLTGLFTEHTAPELLYLETKWASLVSFGLTAQLLKEVLPIGSTANVSTIRSHLHRVATRQETDLGGEQPDLIEGGPTGARQEQVRQEPMIVGIDGGYVRNWHDKKRNFEVLVGKCMPEDREARYFGLVQSQDEMPTRRLAEALRLKGPPINPAIMVLTDGGDSVRAFVGTQLPRAAHYLDWFHIAMRLTGLGQYAKGLAHHNPVEATAVHDRLDWIKWRLWHGDAAETLTHAGELAEDVAALSTAYPRVRRLVKAAAGLATDIENNTGAITDYGERYRHGERISTAFVEATVNLVVSRRFAKKQPMPWSKQGAHRLLQTRTRTLDGTLRDLFTTWYPAMTINDNDVATSAAA
jgi:hypothetical protein